MIVQDNYTHMAVDPVESTTFDFEMTDRAVKIIQP